MLHGVLTPAEAQRLARLYFEKIRGSFVLRYYGLLHHLGHAEVGEFEEVRAIVAKVQIRIAREFGANFVMVNDFFSFRDDKNRMFPDLHQDYDFWVHAKRCSGFNLWIMLDHHRTNYSFDVYDVQHNRAMYRRLYERASTPGGGAAKRSGLGNTRSQQRSGSNSIGSSSHDDDHALRNNHTAGGVPHLEASAFRELRERGAVGGVTATRVNVPLARGDALILRQPEVHRTDRHPLEPGQWRLALGFKVLESAPLDAPRAHFGPVSQDLTQLQVRCPGLVPSITMGQPWPDVYGEHLLARYRSSSAAGGSFVGWLAATVQRLDGEARSSYGVDGLFFLLPFVFCSVMLVLARKAER